jgi:hypothetical protein
MPKNEGNQRNAKQSRSCIGAGKDSQDNSTRQGQGRGNGQGCRGKSGCGKQRGIGNRGY